MSLVESQFDLHVKYRWGLYSFWGGVLLIGTVTRLVKLVSVDRQTSHDGETEVEASSWGHKRRRGRPFTYLQTISHAVTTNLVIPPAFGSHHQRLLWWCYIPTRLETIVVFAYWILNLILCCVSFETRDPSVQNSLFAASYTSPTQLHRFIADRTGIMAFNNLPMLWVFSLRNNCLMWLTGWSFATFMTFHRHISRIVLIQAIVHASTYSAYQAAFDYLAASWNEHYWQMGAMAIIAMGFIHLASSIYFRIKCYELFLVAHIALSVVFLAGLFYHIDHFVGRYDAYIWPLVGVWAFDRAVRIARLAYCNIALFSSGTVVGYNSVASLLGETGLIKLEVTISSQFPTLGAGQHFYLYRPLKWRGWESHPFTLAGWTWTHTETSANEVEQSDSLRDLPEKKAARTDTIATSPPSADAGISLPIPANTPKHDEGSKSTILTTEMEQVSGRKVTFYIRPRGGWTMRLRDECLKEPSRSVRGLTLLEGPYGQVRSPIHTFENVVFVVGGSGITVAMSYLQDYVERTTRPPRRGRTMRTRTRQITLVWVIRKTSMIREITSGGGQLLRVCHRGDVRMRLFATSPRVEEQDEAEVEAEAEPHTLDKGSAGLLVADDQGRQRRQPQLHILHGRPSITDEVFSAINGAASLPQDARTAIVACGPAGIADETRAAVHKVLKEGNDRVEYFEEKFGW